MLANYKVNYNDTEQLVWNQLSVSEVIFQKDLKYTHFPVFQPDHFLKKHTVLYIHHSKPLILLRPGCSI